VPSVSLMDKGFIVEAVSGTTTATAPCCHMRRSEPPISGNHFRAAILAATTGATIIGDDLMVLNSCERLVCL
jgi:hypothetical protein